MKKLNIAVICLSIFFANKSFAGDIYFAPSLIASDIEVKNIKSKSETVVLEKDTVSKGNIGFGADLGYRGNFGRFFIGPEIFFNNYSQTITDFKNQNNPALSDKDKLKIKYVYGLALNLGYKFTPKFALYTRLGFGTAASEITWYNAENTNVVSQKDHSSASIFSIGALYYISKHSALKFAYDSVDYRTNYGFAVFDDTKSFDVNIASFNVGMLFKF